MSVKNRTMLFVIIIFMLLSGVYYYLGYRQAQDSLQAKSTCMEAVTDKVFQSVVQDLFGPYEKRIRTFAHAHPEILEAFAKRDRELLYKRTLPIYTALKDENAFFQTLPFTLPDGINFLRMHDPSMHGDSQGQFRPILKAVAEAGQHFSGFEVGRHGSFYRITQPIFHEGNFIGTIEFGLLSRQITDTLRERLAKPVAEYYLTEEWKKADQQGEQNKVYGNYTILLEKDSPFSQLPPNISLTTMHQEIRLNGRIYILHTHPILKDYDGRVVGGIVALQDISDELEQRKNYLIHSLLQTGLLLSMALAVLFVGFGRLVDPLE